MLLLILEYDHLKPEHCEQEEVACQICDDPRQAAAVVVSDQGGTGRAVLRVYGAGRAELINKNKIMYIFRLQILQRLSVKTTLFCFFIFIYFLLDLEEMPPCLCLAIGVMAALDFLACEVGEAVTFLFSRFTTADFTILSHRPRP